VASVFCCGVVCVVFCVGVVVLLKRVMVGDRYADSGHGDIGVVK